MLKYLDTLHYSAATFVSATEVGSLHYSAATFVSATDVGSLTVECTHHALKFPGDRAGVCCKNGKLIYRYHLLEPIPLWN